MNANSIPLPVTRQGRPLKALAIWLIDACAIVVLSLVVLVLNEFKHQPRQTGEAATK